LKPDLKLYDVFPNNLWYSIPSIIVKTLETKYNNASHKSTIYWDNCLILLIMAVKLTISTVIHKFQQGDAHIVGRGLGKEFVPIIHHILVAELKMW